MANPVNTSTLISVSNQLQRRGVKYVYGGKIENRDVNPRSTGKLSTPPDTIDGLDCSGYMRYVLYQAANWVIPDGSQNQLEYFQDGGFDQLAAYGDTNADVGRNALSIGFIKPYVNGCGPIGHVWLIYKPNDGAAAETFECHGGVGVDSRPWNTIVLTHEVYVSFKLPIV